MATGEGKANPVDTPIPTPDGWKVVGDIKVGDYLFDRFGKPTKVTGVYPQGVIDTYELTLDDKRKIKCAKDHIWSVYRNKPKKQYNYLKDYTTENLFDLVSKQTKDLYYSLPLNFPVEYEAKDLKIDPYLMGWMLGRYSTNNRGDLCFKGLSEDIIKVFAEILGVEKYIQNPINKNSFHLPKTGRRLKYFQPYFRIHFHPPPLSVFPLPSLMQLPFLLMPIFQTLFLFPIHRLSDLPPHLP